MQRDVTRSDDAAHYQGLQQSIAVMVKQFEHGFQVPEHTHERDQFLYASSGLMRAQTASEAWVVPTNRAVYIPAGTPHAVSMHGKVTMCTLYITPKSSAGLPQKVCVLHVHHLLRELILALGEEPVDYAPESRGDLLAQLIELEIGRALEMALYIPLPQDPRLKRLCTAILAEPANRRTLDGWAEVVGAATRTLTRLFEKELGMSFAQWRLRVRFHSALEALCLGEPVAVVAKNHGYRSASAFSAAFRKVLGLRPSELHGTGTSKEHRRFNEGLLA